MKSGKQVYVNKLLKRAIEIKKKIDSLTDLYRELDEITELLRQENFKVAVVGETEVMLVDNFKKSNVAFRTTSVKRYELKIE